MKRIFAFAWLAIKTATRSKLVMCLTIFLITLLVTLPPHIHGDGTINGYARVLLTYTLSFSLALLAIATMWACSCSIANEISSGRIHVVVAKPIRSWEIWLGTWLGSLAINTFFLALSLFLIWGYLKYIDLQPPSPYTAGTTSLRQTLVGKTTITPRTDYIDEEIKRWLSTTPLQQQKDTRKHKVTIDRMRKMLFARNSVVSPGASKEWIFDIKNPSRSDADALLHIHFSTPSLFSRSPVSGVWTITSDQHPEKFSINMTNYPSGRHTFTIPSRFVSVKGTVCVSFLNSSVISQDSDSAPDTVIFHPEEGIQLLVPDISFEANLVRAGLILLARLVLLSAVGIALSALLSAPVAVLATVSVVVLTIFANFFLYVQREVAYIGEDREHEIRALKSSIVYKAGKAGLIEFGRITEPVLSPCINQIARGLTVPLHDVCKAWGIGGLLYPGLLCLISSALMSRRELALSCQRGI